MTDTMKALAKTAPGVGLELIDAPIPEAGPEDVLIKVHRTAVCGTDIHIWNWDEWSQKNVPVPMITGHEFAGEIVAIGKDVDRPLKIGQRVSAEGHVIDLNSEAARAGHFHLDPTVLHCDGHQQRLALIGKHHQLIAALGVDPHVLAVAGLHLTLRVEITNLRPA